MNPVRKIITMLSRRKYMEKEKTFYNQKVVSIIFLTG